MKYPVEKTPRVFATPMTVGKATYILFNGEKKEVECVSIRDKSFVMKEVGEDIWYLHEYNEKKNTYSIVQQEFPSRLNVEQVLDKKEYSMTFIIDEAPSETALSEGLVNHVIAFEKNRLDIFSVFPLSGIADVQYSSEFSATISLDNAKKEAVASLNASREKRLSKNSVIRGFQKFFYEIATSTGFKYCVECF